MPQDNPTNKKKVLMVQGLHEEFHARDDISLDCDT